MVFTEEGLERSRRLLQELFGKDLDPRVETPRRRRTRP
jgi:hypothetical protein